MSIKNLEGADLARHVCRDATPVPLYRSGTGPHPGCGYSASMATACGVKCGPALMEK